ncbi:hypothetical protein LGK95_17915 [Clostridium algoriphilum]|uniref:hypothetical protein n=1 Tax=Clostridium algoriphilum TaxID=198347 RepID=UPI001CF453E4|nr:hypothetical protein [Clostridium algoriphilum]MCB2295362.1 hypothetical protein [Clostridium algoriphilum]
MPLTGKKHLDDLTKQPNKSYWNLNEHPSKDMKELRSNDGNYWYYINTKNKESIEKAMEAVRKLFVLSVVYKEEGIAILESMLKVLK